jgi:hypothetical protein
MTQVILHPALTRTTPDEKMTDRYRHISTKEVIDLMTNEGYSVQSYKVDKTRKFNPETQRHMVIFQHEDATEINGVVPRCIWLNSHNGKTAGIMRQGMYRFVCSNGLIVGNDMGVDRILHSRTMADQVIDRVQKLSAQTLRLYAKIEEWTKFDMIESERFEFAKQAAILRFGEDKYQQYDVKSLLVPRRAEDDKGDLWSTFNIVQENMMKGGQSGVNANGRRVRSKSVNGITQDVHFNSGLWEIADSFVF